MYAPEILYAVGALILLFGLIWGVRQSSRKNPANQPITDKATIDSYRDPEKYAREKPELERQLRP